MRQDSSFTAAQTGSGHIYALYYMISGDSYPVVRLRNLMGDEGLKPYVCNSSISYMPVGLTAVEPVE